MNDDSKWATYRNLSFAPIQITNLLQSSKTEPTSNEESNPLQQNGKYPTPPPSVDQVTAAEEAVEPASEPPGELEAASPQETNKTLYRIGVGAAAFVGLSLVVVFLIRPNLPSSAAPQLPPTATVGRQVAAEVTLSPEQLALLAAPTAAELTQEELAQQSTTEQDADQPQAVQVEPTPAPTEAPTATAVPVLAQVASIPHALAYTVGDAGDGDIYVMQANKLKPFAVANGDCDESAPDWSPDGKRLVFQSNCNGSYDLADVPAGGGKIRYLTATEQYDELDPSYSPDGNTIVFLRLLHGTALDAEGDLWSLNIETGHSFPLDITGRAPVWSADGLKLAFMSLRSGTWDVYIHDFITGNDEMISFGCPTNCGWPEWSPDSSSIAFSVSDAVDDLRPEEIWLWSPERRLPQKWIGGAVGHPSWSTAGVIAYSSGLGLEVSQAQNPERQLLLDKATAWAPEWAQ